MALQWFNQPPLCEEKNGIISVTSVAKTDFWLKTHYDFIHDNGHFGYEEISGDFEAKVKVSGKYEELYDQAGLMVWLDKSNWLKCGIEFVGGVQQCSVVVTRDYSDWSVVPLSQNLESIWLKLIRHKDAIIVNFSLDGHEYKMLRLAYFPPAQIANTVKVGIMCAAPEGNGFSTEFEQLEITKLS